MYIPYVVHLKRMRYVYMICSKNEPIVQNNIVKGIPTNSLSYIHDDKTKTVYTVICTFIYR